MCSYVCIKMYIKYSKLHSRILQVEKRMEQLQKLKNDLVFTCYFKA